MKRMAILNILGNICMSHIIAIALLCIIGCSDSNDGPSSSPEKIVCDKFNLKVTLDGQLLKVSVDTDLPDNTRLMVSVSRLFNIVCDQEEYLIHYLDEKSTVGQWRGGKTLLLDNNKWLSQLVDLEAKWHNIEIANQKFMSDYSNRRIPPEWKESLNKKYEVDKISSSITCRMVVPINQLDPRFGWRNKNLVGTAVSTEDLRIVEDEVQIRYPLKKSPTGRSSPDEK